MCDFFSWDYKSGDLNEFTYLHNPDGKLYEKYDAMAKYNDDDKLIGFNHIRMSKLELDNDEIISDINRKIKQFEKIIKCYEKVNRTAKLAGLAVESFDEIFSQSFRGSELKKHGIETDEITAEYLDVMLIRTMEEYCSIRRIVAHEFGHVIAYSYKLEEDQVIIGLFEQFKDGFEDIQEFIAECFMACELTNKIPLANKVKARINTVINTK